MMARQSFMRPGVVAVGASVLKKRRPVLSIAAPFVLFLCVSIQPVFAQQIPSASVGHGGRFQVGDLLFEIPEDQTIYFHEETAAHSNQTDEPRDKESKAVKWLEIRGGYRKSVSLVSDKSARRMDYWCPKPWDKKDWIVICGKCLSSEGTVVRAPTMDIPASRENDFAVYRTGPNPNVYQILARQATFFAAPIALKVYTNKNNDGSPNNIYKPTLIYREMHM